jgi:hypothetical protein
MKTAAISAAMLAPGAALAEESASASPTLTAAAYVDPAEDDRHPDDATRLGFAERSGRADGLWTSAYQAMEG